VSPQETEAYARAGTAAALALLAALAFVVRTIAKQPPQSRPPTTLRQALALLAGFTLLAFGPLAAAALLRPQPAPAPAAISPDPAASPLPQPAPRLLLPRQPRPAPRVRP
jgi:hypothetical protein